MNIRGPSDGHKMYRHTLNFSTTPHTDWGSAQIAGRLCEAAGGEQHNITQTGGRRRAGTSRGGGGGNMVSEGQPLGGGVGLFRRELFGGGGGIRGSGLL